MGLTPSRYQCWWYSEALGWRCDAYPTPDQALARLREVDDRHHVTRGVAIDMQKHLTSQDGYLAQEEFEEAHRKFTEETTHA